MDGKQETMAPKLTVKELAFGAISTVGTKKGRSKLIVAWVPFWILGSQPFGKPLAGTRHTEGHTGQKSSCQRGTLEGGDHRHHSSVVEGPHFGQDSPWTLLERLCVL